MARGMEDNISIRELALHDNSFSGRGFIALAAALMHTQSLCVLNCAGNGLSDPAAVQVRVANQSVTDWTGWVKITCNFQ